MVNASQNIQPDFSNIAHAKSFIEKEYDIPFE